MFRMSGGGNPWFQFIRHDALLQLHFGFDEYGIGNLRSVMDFLSFQEHKLKLLQKR